MIFKEIPEYKVGEKMDFDKRLSIAQHMGYKFDCSCAFNIQAVIHGRGFLDVQAFCHVLKMQQKRHYYLCSYIEEKSLEFHLFEKEKDIPVTVVELDNIKEWETIRIEDLNKPFIHGLEPYGRVAICKCGEDSIIVITLAHYVADGLSCGQFAHNLMESYGSYIQGKTEGSLDPIEPFSLLGMKVPKAMDYDFSIILPGNEINDVNEKIYVTASQRHTEVRNLSISEDVMSHFEKCCKQEKTTIYGGICAAAMSAMTKVIANTYQTEKRLGVSCVSVVDQSRGIKKRNSYNQLGQGALVARTYRTDIDSTSDLWNIARQSRKQLQNYSKKLGFVKLLIYIKQNLHLSDEAFLKLMEFKDEFVVVSFLGNLDPLCDFDMGKNFKLMDIDVATSVQYLQGNEWGIFIGCYIYKKSLRFTVNYVKEYWNDARIELFCSCLKESIMEMVGENK
jgi:hypothetical protein